MSSSSSSSRSRWWREVQPRREQRLAPVDEANLVLDHAGQTNVFLVAGLLVPEEGGFLGHGNVDADLLRTVIAQRIGEVPQLRWVPVGHGSRHRWRDTTPDLEHHVRILAHVDGLVGFERACGELMTVPLPLDRPLWELLLVPGAIPRGVGLILRIHHAIADGMAAVGIVQRLFDHGGPVGADPTPLPPIRGHERSEGRRRIGYGMERIRMTLIGREIGETVLLGKRSPHRGVRFLSTDLGALEFRTREAGSTINDALLAAVASGYRRTLSCAGESVPDRLPVSVPVALPRRGAIANRVGVMLVRLPLGEADPDTRLRLIAAQTRPEKERARRQGTLELMRGPVGARIMDRLGNRQRLVAGFVTNVPGPRGTLHLAGASVAAIWPVAVLAANVRLGVAAVSYGGRLCCGIHFDTDSVPGDEFAHAMAEEFRRLAGDAASSAESR
jgi:diacylglycerol O-acyltransferase